MASSDTLTHAVVEPSTLMPSSGVIQQSSAVHTSGAGSINVAEAGVFASASLVSFRNRKEVELNEVCTTMLAKIPKVWTKVSVFFFFHLLNGKKLTEVQSFVVHNTTQTFLLIVPRLLKALVISLPSCRLPFFCCSLHFFIIIPVITFCPQLFSGIV